jgi:hypothetical protein
MLKDDLPHKLWGRGLLAGNWRRVLVIHATLNDLRPFFTTSSSSNDDNTWKDCCWVKSNQTHSRAELQQDWNGNVSREIRRLVPPNRYIQRHIMNTSLVHSLSYGTWNWVWTLNSPHVDALRRRVTDDLFTKTAPEKFHNIILQMKRRVRTHVVFHATISVIFLGSTFSKCVYGGILQRNIRKRRWKFFRRKRLIGFCVVEFVIDPIQVWFRAPSSDQKEWWAITFIRFLGHKTNKPVGYKFMGSSRAKNVRLAVSFPPDPIYYACGFHVQPKNRTLSS